MKYLHRFLGVVPLAALFIVPAFAQWQVPLGHTPYGMGRGTGFGSQLTYPAGAYGVKCDGTTNNAGALNTAIQTAAVTGGVVQLPIGRCKIGSTVLLASGVTVRGQGGALALNSVFSGVAAPVYPTSLIWTGGASGVMVDSPAFMQDGSLQDLTIDGGVASGSIGTSALKGIRLRSGWSNKFERVSIQNAGVGISIEPNFAGATLALKLTEWNTFSDIRMLLVGDGIDFAANATLLDVAGGAGGVTNNFFYRTVIYGYINYGIKFAAMADDNHFDGGHIAGGSGSVGVIYNSLSAAAAVGTYANDFTNFDLEVDDFVGNAYPIIVNNTNGFSSTFKGVIASQGTFFNGIQIANGGLLTVINNLDPAGPRQQTDANSASGLTMINTNAGSNANTKVTLGTNADSGLAQITANSSTNTALGGANSLNFSNSASAPIAFWMASSKAGQFGISGFDVGNSSTGNALRSVGNSTGNPVGLSAIGVDTNIQINIAAKGSAAVNVQSPLNANTFNGNIFTTGTGTLTLAAGKTLTQSNTLTYTGTDGSTVAFGAGGTVLYGNQTITLTGDVGGSGTTAITTTLTTAQPAIHTWALTQTFTVAPVFTAQSGTRTALGLGTAATQNTGTSGANLPFLNGTNTWAGTQTFTLAPVFTDASGSRTALGLGTMATQAASSVAITGGTIAGLTGLAIRDTSAAFDVTLAAASSSALSAGRTLTLNMGNVAHTLAFGTTANTITFPNLSSFTVITNGDTGTVTNAMLANSTISGVALGSNLAALSYGTHLTNSAGASSYNGSAVSTIATDATNANTVSTIVARDGSGNFSAGTITASLTGLASLNCALTGCTYSGNINLAATNPVLLLQGGTAAGQGPIQQFTDTTPQNIGAIGKEAAILGSGTSSNFMINAYQTALDLAIGSSIKATLDVSKFNLGSGVSYYTNGTKGVTCSGALTVISSITITSGIITAATGTGGTCS